MMKISVFEDENLYKENYVKRISVNMELNQVKTALNLYTDINVLKGNESFNLYSYYTIIIFLPDFHL